jgi:hypothetical protein
VPPGSTTIESVHLIYVRLDIVSNLPENLPASRNILSLAIIYVRRHRGRTLFGDWRSHRSISARYNRRSS